jgi:hypothetical protein
MVRTKLPRARRPWDESNEARDVRLQRARTERTCVRLCRAQAAHAAAAEADPALPCGLDRLPHAAVLLILRLVPFHERTRLTAVAKSWRAFCSAVALWADLDLTERGGVPRAVVSDAMLFQGAALAGGQLRTLQLELRRDDPEQAGGGELAGGVKTAALHVVLSANAHTLRRLRLGVAAQHGGRCGADSFAAIEVLDLYDLLRVVPLLDACEVDAVECSPLNSPRALLLREGPYRALHMRRLQCPAFTAAALEEEVLGHVAQHGSLEELHIDDCQIDVRATVEDIVEAAISARLRALAITNPMRHQCTSMGSEDVPAVVRLLKAGWLHQLYLACGDAFDSESVASFAKTLKRNKTLRALDLHFQGCRQQEDVLTALLDALAGHPRIEQLWLRRLITDDDAATSAGVVRLVAAAPPQLRFLHVSGTEIQQADLFPLFQALAANTSLATLYLQLPNDSAELMQAQLLPLLRANTALRSLRVVEYDGSCEEVQWAEAWEEAEELVAARTAA